jgi:hypothetical protein
MIQTGHICSTCSTVNETYFPWYNGHCGWFSPFESLPALVGALVWEAEEIIREVETEALVWSKLRFRDGTSFHRSSGGSFTASGVIADWSRRQSSSNVSRCPTKPSRGELLWDGLRNSKAWPLRWELVQAPSRRMCAKLRCTQPEHSNEVTIRVKGLRTNEKTKRPL